MNIAEQAMTINGLRHYWDGYSSIQAFISRCATPFRMAESTRTRG